MAQARLPMRKIREVLRLKCEARLSDEKVAQAIGSARSTVQECLRRAREVGLTWPLPGGAGQSWCACARAIPTATLRTHGSWADRPQWGHWRQFLVQRPQRSPASAAAAAYSGSRKSTTRCFFDMRARSKAVTRCRRPHTPSKPSTAPRWIMSWSRPTSSCKAAK